MMMIAPRSSMIARASRNTLSDGGARGPSKARTPSAKAISVAVGIAQPRRASSSPQLQARETSAGPAIPPKAPTTGSAAFEAFDSSPSMISRLTSSPTSMKKTAISPSLTHSSKGLAMAQDADLNCNRQFEELRVERFERRIGQDERDHGGGAEHDAARRLQLEELLK